MVVTLVGSLGESTALGSSGELDLGVAVPARIALDSPDAVDGRHIRAVTFQPVRLQYVRNVLARSGLEPAGAPAVVVGSIRGELARGLAALGMDVTALDPSPVATQLARDADGGGTTRYRTAAAEDLSAFPDGAFAFAYYADTFEVTPDLPAVAGHAARVLRPGGVLVYDTVARTPVSRLVYLGAFQAIPATRIVPPGHYRTERLRPPAEVAGVLGEAGLCHVDVCGFRPRSVAALVRAVLGRKSGRLRDEDLATAVEFVLDPDHAPVVTYLGTARKPLRS
jgi:2-polyprenyl-6-hydroxyphenyl methylase/3-demethylubiquinone-9 3-methyltransferase